MQCRYMHLPCIQRFCEMLFREEAAEVPLDRG